MSKIEQTANPIWLNDEEHTSDDVPLTPPTSIKNENFSGAKTESDDWKLKVFHGLLRFITMALAVLMASTAALGMSK
jgi:hypothetical protein